MPVRKYLEPALLALVLLAIVALIAYPYLRRSPATVTNILAAPAAETNDKRYSTDMKELRARFNQDKGRVRLILLLSPT